MRHRRSRSSFVLGVATALVATSPFIAITLFGPAQAHTADGTVPPPAVPTQLYSVPLGAVPALPLSRLNQPDLRIPDLKKFIAPPSLAFLGAHPIAGRVCGLQGTAVPRPRSRP